MARHPVRFVVAFLVLLLTISFVAACGDKGPKSDVRIRVLVTHRWPETMSFRGLDFKGKEYDVFITDKTIINSGTDEKFTFDKIVLGDELDLWLDKIPKTPEPDPPQYEAVQMNIAPTTR